MHMAEQREQVWRKIINRSLWWFGRFVVISRRISSCVIAFNDVVVRDRLSRILSRSSPTERLSMHCLLTYVSSCRNCDANCLTNGLNDISSMPAATADSTHNAPLPGHADHADTRIGGGFFRFQFASQQLARNGTNILTPLHQRRFYQKLKRTSL